MKNKVLVELIVPAIDQTYNVYFPVNRKIGNIINLLNKSLYEITNGSFIGTNRTYLYDRNNGEIYPIDTLVRDTNIRNGTSVVLL